MVLREQAEKGEEMTGRINKQNHMTSLRLPDNWHQWIERFAENYHVPPAYIYRSAIRQFIERNGQVA
jgi:predicted DNA-binding protein